ncbi:uncharacterized protein BDZ83DRAFT_137920 [Colletotrichum acutatum]|uniref:Uncharacterized protein n=1 Tax=Glomerella acutata TaxID=27357 RepID=A0AAD8URP8_GLOAC|nr:uncharacterized protein BDZ83DRAFT_137920 [Colletotrichum acutatum]KAK1728253.1 hypothetical protein BDZ83DRAFT_137920 [Colletotrichum acutatum]
MSSTCTRRELMDCGSASASKLLSLPLLHIILLFPRCSTVMQRHYSSVSCMFPCRTCKPAATRRQSSGMETVGGHYLPLFIHCLQFYRDTYLLTLPTGQQSWIQATR